MQHKIHVSELLIHINTLGAPVVIFSNLAGKKIIFSVFKFQDITRKENI